MTDQLHDPYAGHGPKRYAGTDEQPDIPAPGPAEVPYTAQQVFGVLKVLGYGAGQADLAMARALAHGSWPLSRHVVRYDGEAGTYAVTGRRAS
jgi:hypothetical protein